MVVGSEAPGALHTLFIARVEQGFGLQSFLFFPFFQKLLTGLRISDEHVRVNLDFVLRGSLILDSLVNK